MNWKTYILAKAALLARCRTEKAVQRRIKDIAFELKFTKTPAAKQEEFWIALREAYKVAWEARTRPDLSIREATSSKALNDLRSHTLKALRDAKKK